MPGSTCSSLRGSDNEGAKTNSESCREGRQRSFSDCTTLPPIGTRGISNKRGPQTIGSNSQIKHGDGIANSEHFGDDRITQYQREPLDRCPSRTHSLPPLPRGPDPGEHYPPSSGSSHTGTQGRPGRRNLDPGFQFSGLLSLQTCSHPVRHDLSSLGCCPDITSNGNRERERERECRTAMDIVIRDDTDHSHDSSQSSTPTSTPAHTYSAIAMLEDEESQFPPTVCVGRMLNRGMLSGALSDARTMMATGTGTATASTTPNTARSTPDVSPLHSPYRHARTLEE
jgi:hypothetical protein